MRFIFNILTNILLLISGLIGYGSVFLREFSRPAIRLQHLQLCFCFRTVHGLTSERIPVPRIPILQQYLPYKLWRSEYCNARGTGCKELSVFGLVLTKARYENRSSVTGTGQKLGQCNICAVFEKHHVRKLVYSRFKMRTYILSGSPYGFNCEFLC